MTEQNKHRCEATMEGIEFILMGTRAECKMAVHLKETYQRDIKMLQKENQLLHEKNDEKRMKEKNDNMYRKDTYLEAVQNIAGTQEETGILELIVKGAEEQRNNFDRLQEVVLAKKESEMIDLRGAGEMLWKKNRQLETERQDIENSYNNIE